jgi:hypothetical protein
LIVESLESTRVFEKMKKNLMSLRELFINE